MSFRVEEKLLVRSNQVAGLLKWLSDENSILLHPKRRIYSTYFDTAAFSIFSDSEEGSVPRKKIRIRTYNASGHFKNPNALEVKISSIEGRFKTTRALSNDEARELLSVGIFDPTYGTCDPVVSVAYNREYFQVHDVRLTIDTDIEYCAMGSKFPVKDDSTAVEIKASSTASMDMLSQAFPFRRTRFSKYARSILATQKGTGEWL